MPDQTLDQNLHLPSLVIKNFRGIDELTIPRLGRVTLLTGKNGVGKTTVLEAVRIYAAREKHVKLIELLHGNDEVFKDEDATGKEVTVADWRGLFSGHQLDQEQTISIGPAEIPGHIQIRFAPFTDEDRVEFAGSESGWYNERWGIEITAGLRRVMRPHDVAIPERLTRRANRVWSLAQEIACIKLGPDVPSNATITGYLNDVVLTTKEGQAIEALNIVTSLPVERVSMVYSGALNGSRSERHVIVKQKGVDIPTPLRSLGDGAVRAFAVALALANSTDGFLLIDEAENGIHHSIQTKFWNMVLQTAQRNNVQVIATTHSWDCVVGFAEAANDLEDVEGLLVRIERPPAGLRPITYDESRLKNIAKNGIEVR